MMVDQQLLFDKLAYIDRLKRAGISEDHARAHADAMDEAFRESIATKPDIVRLEHKIGDEVARLEHKIDDQVARLEHKIGDEVARLEHKIADEVTRLEHKIDLAVRDLTIRMGVIAVALFAALAPIKFFG
jgi:hypothetical protein